MNLRSGFKKILFTDRPAVFFLLLGLVFLGIGIFREETATVLIKSINICLECIGIG